MGNGKWKIARRSWVAVLAGLLLLFVTPAASAQVNTTKAPTAGSTVYIAGNPDFYPLEYYDTRTETYQGVLPALYAQISEDTGVDFTYIDAGRENQQQRLAKNRQVEIVSAYAQGEIKNLQEEYTLFTFERDGEPCTACVGFTEIITPELLQLLKEQLDAVDEDTWLSMTLAQTAEPKTKWSVILLLSAVILALLAATAVLTVRLLKNRNAGKKQQQDKQIDTLTGIGNAAFFQYSFEHYITAASRSLYYIAYIAVDMQRVEQYFGTTEAQELQRYAAGVLSAETADTDFAARLSDGVFALAFQCPNQEQAAEYMAERVMRLNGYGEKFFKEYRVVFQAGVFALGASEMPFETALYNARQGYLNAVRNKTAYCFSDPALLKREALKQRLQRKLTDALENREFKLYMQFIVDAQTGRICGAETLSRWQSPQEGLLMPSQYVEAMQTAGIIDQLDFYIMEEACRQLEAWGRTGKKEPWLSCNFTRITVSSPDFFERFQAIADRYTFDHRRLVIELTEDSLTDNQTVAFQNVLACKKAGFRIALDDLGSGYSSFSDLCDYPIDVIKVDRHIVSKSVTERGGALLQGICKLARDLNIEVLCEGVESEEENAFARTTGCAYIQGYYYSRVYPQAEALDFCEKNREDDETLPLGPVLLG